MSDKWQEIVDAALTVSKDGGSRVASLVLAADDYIEELEARHANDCEEIAKWREIVSGRTISENFEVVWRERVNRLEAKLAKAVAALGNLVDIVENSDTWVAHTISQHDAVTTLAELKGETND